MCFLDVFTKGIIQVPVEAIGEDALMEIVLESGAEDMTKEGKNYEIRTSVEDFDKVKVFLEAKKIPIESAEISPSLHLYQAGGKHAEQMLRLFDKLEDLDDVQNVWANFDISDDDIEKKYNQG